MDTNCFLTGSPVVVKISYESDDEELAAKSNPKVVDELLAEAVRAPTTPLQLADELFEAVEKACRPYGMEAHRFLVGWYNDQVAPPFHLPYESNTLAFLILSTPSMFEKAFLPFVRRGMRLEATADSGAQELKADDCSTSDSSEEEDEVLPPRKKTNLDPVDNCCSSVLRQVASQLPYPTDVVADFEMVNRRPRILVQTMGHVSGAAYFYQRKHLPEDPFAGSEPQESDKKFLGVSIHPLFGGWFAFRGAIVIKSFLCPELPRKPCVDVVADPEQRAWLIREFNLNWKEWRYRDVIPVCARYSAKQREYFATLPADRQKLLDLYLKSEDSEYLSDE
jgi:methylmalonic aciduria homocystinuria type C protein